MKDLTGNALREHRDLERETLERVQSEALNLERLPEGQEPRDSTIVEQHPAPEPKRIHGKLSVRW